MFLKNMTEEMVGAPGFEPGASCAQTSGAISWKSFLFNLHFENKRLSKRNRSARCMKMWLRMHGVPQFSPQRRNSERRSPMPDSCVTPTLRLEAERAQCYLPEM